MGNKESDKKKKEKKSNNPLVNASLEKQVNARTIEWKVMQEMLINEPEAADTEQVVETNCEANLDIKQGFRSREKTAWDITSDRTRQFKSMQQEKDEKKQELQEKTSQNTVEGQAA